MRIVYTLLMRSVDHDVKNQLQQVEDDGAEAEDDGAEPQEEAGVGLGVVEGGGELDHVGEDVEEGETGHRVHVQVQRSRLHTR